MAIRSVDLVTCGSAWAHPIMWPILGVLPEVSCTIRPASFSCVHYVIAKSSCATPPQLSKKSRIATYKFSLQFKFHRFAPEVPNCRDHEAMHHLQDRKFQGKAELL